MSTYNTVGYKQALWLNFFFAKMSELYNHIFFFWYVKYHLNGKYCLTYKEYLDDRQTRNLDRKKTRKIDCVSQRKDTHIIIHISLLIGVYSEVKVKLIEQSHNTVK